MENAADALKLAFAIFVFVIAITVTLSLISQAKSTSDKLIYLTDKTNFYEKLKSSEYSSEGRIVGIDSVISTIYRYREENFAVKVVKGGTTIIEFDLDKETNGTLNPTLKQIVNNKAELKKTIGKIIEDNLMIYYDESTFLETFIEVAVDGKYLIKDNEEILITSGVKKIYITYTVQT